MNNVGLILFDIDGVIRDVTNSYRMAIQETVSFFCAWKPSIKDIDSIKSEGIWNNDWDLTLEMIKRYAQNNSSFLSVPTRKELIECFENYYFGGDPNHDSSEWSGFINNEKLLINKNFFDELTHRKIGWGFVSGAELPSAKFILEKRLGLTSAPLVAMGDAPDKPDPTGLISLSSKLSEIPLGFSNHPIAYVGDTVADVKTVMNARIRIPHQKFISLAIAPPHLHLKSTQEERKNYEDRLKAAGADLIIKSLNDFKNQITPLFTNL